MDHFAATICQPLEDVPGQNAATGKAGSFFHELKKEMLAFAADHGCTGEVDDDLSSVPVCIGLLPGFSELSEPGFS